MELSELLALILGHHERLGRSLDSILVQGISRIEVVDAFGKIGLCPPDDLIEMYGQYNGTAVIAGDLLDDAHFFPGFYWLPIQEALTIYCSICRDSRWDKAWFPVFANGGGDFYGVVSDPTSREFGCVVGFILGEPDQPIEYNSLRSMLQVIERCFSSGIYFVTPGGFLETDDEAQFEIAAELNSGLEFYKS